MTYNQTFVSTKGVVYGQTRGSCSLFKKRHVTKCLVWDNCVQKFWILCLVMDGNELQLRNVLPMNMMAYVW